MPSARALETSSELELCETDDDNRDMAVPYDATGMPGTASSAVSQAFQERILSDKPLEIKRLQIIFPAYFC